MDRLHFGREDGVWKVLAKFLLHCWLDVQGGGSDAQLVLSSAVLVNLEVVIILGAYCYCWAITPFCLFALFRSLCFSTSWSGYVVGNQLLILFSQSS